MSRTILITRSAQTVSGGAASGNTLSYSYTVTASGAVNFPAGNAVFRMNRRPADPNNPGGTTVNDYQGVAAPIDLTALGVNNPLTGSTLFLTASISLTFANQDDADQAWLQLKADVQTLKTALDQQDVLSIVETFVPR